MFYRHTVSNVKIRMLTGKSGPFVSLTFPLPCLHLNILKGVRLLTRNTQDRVIKSAQKTQPRAEEGGKVRRMEKKANKQYKKPSILRPTISLRTGNCLFSLTRSCKSVLIQSLIFFPLHLKLYKCSPFYIKSGKKSKHYPKQFCSCRNKKLVIICFQK